VTPLIVALLAAGGIAFGVCAASQADRAVAMAAPVESYNPPPAHHHKAKPAHKVTPPAPAPVVVAPLPPEPPVEAPKSLLEEMRERIGATVPFEVKIDQYPPQAPVEAPKPPPTWMERAHHAAHWDAVGPWFFKALGFLAIGGALAFIANVVRQLFTKGTTTT
jgi:hypothetical protein